MKLEFHFDFGSPNAYLSHLLIPAIEKRTGQKINYVPVLIGGVFKACNNVSPAVSMQGIKNKPDYARIEMERFIRRHEIDNFTQNPFFPVNTLKIMRGAIFAQESYAQDYAQEKGFFAKYVNEVYRHMWAEPKKMDDQSVIIKAFEESSLPSSDILAGMQDTQIKNKLIENTNRSVEMGSFGSPTFFVDGEIYFGKDKLREFEERIVALS